MPARTPNAAGLVRGGEDYAASHGDRPAPQRRVEQLLDGGVEGVEVSVQDRRLAEIGLGHRRQLYRTSVLPLPRRPPGAARSDPLGPAGPGPRRTRTSWPSKGPLGLRVGPFAPDPGKSVREPASYVEMVGALSSALRMKLNTSVASAICLAVGLPCPWPASVSTRSRMGAVPPARPGALLRT